MILFPHLFTAASRQSTPLFFAGCGSSAHRAGRPGYPEGVHPQARLNLIRTYRAVGGRDTGIADAVARERDRLERAARDDGTIASAWDRVAPERLRGRAAIVSMRGGVLTVRCRSASDRFALDRWLRGGGEKALRSAARVALKRVRLVLR